MFGSFCCVQHNTQYPLLTLATVSIEPVCGVLGSYCPSATDPHIRSGSMFQKARRRLPLCCPGALASAFGPSVPPSAALWGPGTALEHRLVHPRIAGSGVTAGIAGGVTLPVLEDPPSSCPRQRAHFTDFWHMKKHRCQSPPARFEQKVA